MNGPGSDSTACRTAGYSSYADSAGQHCKSRNQSAPDNIRALITKYRWYQAKRI